MCKASMATILGVLASTGMLPELSSSTPKLDKKQEEDEEKFLATLSGEPKQIWRRRIAKGLSQSELDFIRGRLYDRT